MIIIAKVISVLATYGVMYWYFSPDQRYKRAVRRDLNKCFKNKSITDEGWFQHLDNIDQLLDTTNIKKYDHD